VSQGSALYLAHFKDESESDGSLGKNKGVPRFRTVSCKRDTEAKRAWSCSLCDVGGNHSIRFTTLAETSFAPAVENPVYQMVGNSMVVVNALMTLFAFPLPVKRW